jgi:ribonucleoside-diphosphate reductase alpha chain
MQLSVDMRCRDRGYLRKKLESLAKRKGEAFDGVMPDGTPVRFPSALAAFARLVLFRCEQLGTFEQFAGDTSVMDALLCKREPKTTPDGSTAWYVDIANPASKDDFKMFVAEADLPNGQRRPFSVWFSGDYPKALDGLAVSLSLDMQVVDPAWVGRKLKQLLDHDEPRAEFLAQVPGSEKRRMYPSTIAYLAQLLLHRFAQLDLLTESGEPVKDSGVVQLQLIQGGVNATSEASKPKGELCPSCHAYAVVRSGGCEQCLSCSETRCG